jgi:ligand-binding sensor domain-containing protein/serine phosphatase RsbU (regulator of sigma subunit)
VKLFLALQARVIVIFKFSFGLFLLFRIFLNMLLLIRYFFFFFLFVTLLFSCSDKKQEHKNKELKLLPAIGIVPNPDSLTPPQITFIDACIKPLTITVSVKSGGSYTKISKEKSEINLLAPIITPAGFFVPMQNYNTEQGLALASITCSFKDKRGNLWFGTSGAGVSCYDGKSFINFTIKQGLANNNVYSIAEDKKGNLWFGTDGGGVSCYDGKSFTTFTTRQGLSDNTIFSILEDKKGNLWFGTNRGGISFYNGKSFINYVSIKNLANNSVWSIIEDKKGNIWFGTSDGASCFNGKSFINYNLAQGLINNDVSALAEDKKGNIWFGTNGGISCFDGKSFVNYTTAQGLPANPITSIAKDKEENLWFGTKGGGALYYDGNSSSGGRLNDSIQGLFTSYTTAQGLVNNNIRTITSDESGNIWFGIAGNGVSRYDGKSFTTYTAAQGLTNDVIWSITEDKKGNLWFGTDKGILKYDGKLFVTWGVDQGLLNDQIFSSLEDKSENMWFGTSEGVSCYDGKSFTHYNAAQGFTSQKIWSITEDKKGGLWFGTNGGGVSHYNGKSFTNYTTKQGLVNNTVWSSKEDKNGKLWFGTSEGLSCYNGKTFTNFTIEQGLANNVVRCIIEDMNGNLWFGTDGGLSRYDGKSFLTFFIGQGFTDDAIYDMVLDEEGTLWLGTNSGFMGLKFEISKAGKKQEVKGAGSIALNNDELKNYAPIWEEYNNKTGYPVKDINLHAMCITKRKLPFGSKQDIGAIWAGCGDNKVVRFEPNAMYKKITSPVIHIQNIKIEGKAICWYDLDENEHDSTTKAQQEIMAFGNLLKEQERDSMKLEFEDIAFDSISRFYPIPQNLTLPYEHNSLTFDFAAIEPARSHLIKYRYILEGYDKGWCPATDKTSATFGNVHEGTYTFKIIAQNLSGVWSEPVTYAFKVLPPWWRAWWMYLIYILLATGTVLLIVQWNGRRLIVKAKDLKEKVDMATTEIRKQKDAVEEQKTIIESKNKDITDSMHYAKHIQNILMKEEEHVNLNLPEHFIFFMPKDILSGDFYWGVEKQNHFYLAVVDCTGHGVPGALMSMLGMVFINQITASEKLHNPAEVLNRLRNKVINELTQSGKAEMANDGMDMALLRFNLSPIAEGGTTYNLQFAGANNSLYLVRNKEIQEIKGNKQPIGHYPKSSPFTNHEIQLQKGDIVYMFSDGYADQFGGPHGKKFKYKQLTDLLLNASHFTVKEQKEILRKTFIDWKGNLEQVDDVCVIGMRI